MLRETGLNYPPGTPLREHFEKRLANREPLATFALDEFAGRGTGAVARGGPGDRHRHLARAAAVDRLVDLPRSRRRLLALDQEP